MPRVGPYEALGLSPQEEKVLSLAILGLIDKEIAAKMGIGLGTVRIYWKRIRLKLGGTRSEAIAHAARAQGSGDSFVADATGQLMRIEHAAFEAVSTPIAIHRPEDRLIIRFNSAFARIHGYLPNEIHGMDVIKLIAKPHHARYERLLIDADARGRGSLILDRVRSDGTAFRSYTEIATFRSEMGKVMGRVTTVMDVRATLSLLSPH